MKELWTEKYRPSTLNGYVFRDDDQKRQVQSWIDSKSIPHLLFSGEPGTGKTTLAKILINELGVDEYDVKEINASRETGIDDVRNVVTGFVSTMPFGEFKVVLLDEADYMSKNAQASLRSLMEEHHATARFILTCNYPRKIIPALHSRCEGFHIEKIDQTEFTARVAQILITEEVDFELDILDNYVKATYPDLRSCIKKCQTNSIDGTLHNLHKSDSSSYKFAAVELFKQGNIKEARQHILSNVQSDAEIEGMYRWLYNNLDLFGTTDEEKDQAILAIRTGLVNHAIVADPEINLSATLVELTTLT
jgi:replication factor C small subunit